MKPWAMLYRWSASFAVQASSLPSRAVDIPKAKSREHAAAREHGMYALRHFYVGSAGRGRESIKAVSAYLGHSLTLKVYAHLMPSSREEGSPAARVRSLRAHSGPRLRKCP